MVSFFRLHLVLLLLQMLLEPFWVPLEDLILCESVYGPVFVEDLKAFDFLFGARGFVFPLSLPSSFALLVALVLSVSLPLLSFFHLSSQVSELGDSALFLEPFLSGF